MLTSKTEKRQKEFQIREKLFERLSLYNIDDEFNVLIWRLAETGEIQYIPSRGKMIVKSGQCVSFRVEKELVTFTIKKSQYQKGSYVVNNAMHSITDYGTPLFKIIEEGENVDDVIKLVKSYEQMGNVYKQDFKTARELFDLNILNLGLDMSSKLYD